MLGFYYFDYYLFLLPALVLVFWAQAMVSSRYKKYGKIANSRGMTGAQMAEYMLSANGINDVRVQHTAGDLTDHYHPTEKVVYLSDGVYHSTSVAALGIAAHEVGHAVQHAQGYFPIKLRMAILPVCNIGSRLSIPLLLIGALLNFPLLVNLALILFGAVTLFQLVTLPVEFNASARAIAVIRDSGRFSSEDLKGCKKMLTAAAMTYVAAFAQSLLSLLYYILRFSGRNRRG